MSLAGKRIFITGGSRGIGLAIALRAAADGAFIAIAAKTSEPNPKLPGTIHTAAAEIEAAGGKALAIQCDLRDELQIEAAVNQAAEAFGFHWDTGATAAYPVLQGIDGASALTVLFKPLSGLLNQNNPV